MGREEEEVVVAMTVREGCGREGGEGGWLGSRGRKVARIGEGERRVFSFSLFF